MNSRTIIKKPWVSEKSTVLQRDGKYVFIVERNSSKQEVRKAIKSIYGVDILSVNIVKKPSKVRHFRGRTGRTRGFKKAIVTLKKGQKIDLV